jgi:hypothetical protein
MNDEQTRRIDDFIARVRAFRMTATIGSAMGWDADASEIDVWLEKYPKLHVPNFFRAYTVDRDDLHAALEGGVDDEIATRGTMRELIHRQFGEWLRNEGVHPDDLDAMVAAYNLNPLAGLPPF